MYKIYGFWGGIRLLISLIYTKIYFRKARLIRLPFDIRNRRHIYIGEKFVSGFGCRIEAFPVNSSNKHCIHIGNNVQINDYVHITACENVKIGNNVLLASKIFISDLNHGNYSIGDEHDNPNSIPINRKLFSNPVIIEDNVWIGESVSVLGGVTIGYGSIIGCNSVVTKNIPPNSIAVGNPAMAIKKFNFETKKWEKVL